MTNIRYGADDQALGRGSGSLASFQIKSASFKNFHEPKQQVHAMTVTPVRPEEREPQGAQA